MDVGRRSFLSGLMSLACAATIPSTAIASLAEIPMIHGDGVGDDTAGLQALFDGKPFRVKEGAFVNRVGDVVELRHTTHKLSKMLTIGKGCKGSIRGSYFKTTPDFSDECVLFFPGGGGPFECSNCTIIMGSRDNKSAALSFT